VRRRVLIMGRIIPREQRVVVWVGAGGGEGGGRGRVRAKGRTRTWVEGGGCGGCSELWSLVANVWAPSVLAQGPPLTLRQLARRERRGGWGGVSAGQGPLAVGRGGVRDAGKLFLVDPGTQLYSTHMLGSRLSGKICVTFLCGTGYGCTIVFLSPLVLFVFSSSSLSPVPLEQAVPSTPSWSH